MQPGARDVFLNIPFDQRHERLYIALVAGLAGLGLTARCVLEILPQKDRLSRIVELIRRCQASIHDLSRVELSRGKPRCPRFNMPFEAGLAIGSVHGTSIKHRWFVFETVNFRLQKSLSDLNGYDPFVHGGTVRGVLGALTEAFVRPGVTIDELLTIYRRLRRVAAMLRKRRGDVSLFNRAAFRALVLSAEEIAKDVLDVH